MQPIGEFLCQNCGPREISDPENLFIVYPAGANHPRCTVVCEFCGMSYSSEITWNDALTFDLAGANTEPFSFSRGPVMEEGEIDTFVNNMDEEIEVFLDATASGK